MYWYSSLLAIMLPCIISANARIYVFQYLYIYTHIHTVYIPFMICSNFTSFSVQVAILGGGAFGTAMATHVVGRAKVMGSWSFKGHPMLLAAFQYVKIIWCFWRVSIISLDSRWRGGCATRMSEWVASGHVSCRCFNMFQMFMAPQNDVTQQRA